MTQLCDKLQTIGSEISSRIEQYQRTENSVQLLAVSKRHPLTAIREAYACGQRAFGENYVQEMLEKAEEISDLDIEWHFIGPLQSNKTKQVAAVADWVHTIDRLKIAKRLSNQRPDDMPPLSVCLQVNIDEEKSKSGVLAQDLPELALQVAKLPKIILRGLMVIPKASSDFQQQRATFAKVSKLQDDLNLQLKSSGVQLDTLSMGMSGDMQAAIAEGATIVRIGTAIFGSRPY